jgi:arabinogalactan oligomer/maltooligosaccharide transport system substrate-binding protein
MKIRTRSIATAVAGLATAAMIAVSTPAHAAVTTNQLLIWVDNGNKPVIQKVVYAWAAANDVEITLVGKDFGQTRDLVKTAVPAGTGPDVLAAAPHDWTGNLAAAGVLRTITLPAAVKAGLASNALAGFRVDGKQYGVPAWTENIAWLRNVKKAPKAVTSLSQVKNGELEIGYGSDGGDPYHFYPLQTAFGAPVFTSTSAGWTTTLGMKNAGGNKFAAWLESKGTAFFGAPSNWGNLACDFILGKKKYWITGPWSIGDIEGGKAGCTVGLKVGTGYAIDKFPKGDKAGVQFMGVRGFYITNSASTDVKAATKLLTYLAGSVPQTVFFTKDAKTPANLKALAVAKKNKVIAGFAAAGATAVPMPNIPAMDSVWDKWGKAEARLIKGTKVEATAAAEWTKMATEIQALING